MPQPPLVGEGILKLTKEDNVAIIKATNALSYRTIGQSIEMRLVRRESNITMY